jgi:hypothetical protein
MDTADMVKMQEQFAQDLSEFSARIVSVWSDAAKRMDSLPGKERGLKGDSAWPNFWAFAKPLDTAGAGARIQETVLKAAEDLPALFAGMGDAEKVERIKGKWARLYADSAREFLGIPKPTDTERLLDHWRQVKDSLPSVGKTSRVPFPSLISLMYPLRWPVPGLQDERRGWLRMWEEAAGKNWGNVFVFPPGGAGADREAVVRRAVEAQIGFLQSLPEFREHVLAASKTAVETLVAHLRGLGSREMTSETPRLFFAAWVSANEKMFRELFGSDTFLQTLTRTVQQGLTARNMMDSAFADWSAAWDRANQQDVGDLRDKLYTLEKRVRLLERELEVLKQELAKSPSSRNSNDEA